MTSEIKIINEHLQFSRVTLKTPLSSGFMILAAEVDKKTSIWGESKSKKTLLQRIKTLTPSLKSLGFIKEATLFKASLFPPGRDGAYLKQARENSHEPIHDKFDVVFLIELESVSKCGQLEHNPTFQTIVKSFKELSSFFFVLQAENLRRIDTVDHASKGVFLFNFFIANHKKQNLAIWEYTAGWFQDETGLDNSTLFGPVMDSSSEYSVINHCRWDSLWSIIPSLIFKKTFRSYVLANFEGNNVAAIPILYKLA